MNSSTLRAINLGTIAPFNPAEASAIAKTPVSHAVAIGPLGLQGDEQADRVHHGGPDKAIHHYPHDHYPFWQDLLGDHALLNGEGAFGENISTCGLTETTVCLGDRFRLGSALVEISQGRQPCWKLDHRFDHPGVMAAVVRTARSGWYYRVIESGTACVGDPIELVNRPLAEWSVARCFALLVGGAHSQDPAAVRALANEPLLATPWRERAARLMG
ncbi:MAG: hypothetical protein RIQ99_1818 [Pseudomonadota bacterium]|jgi:MOSC domain-containing protein YiiM